jgi:predicted small metal-binding protein
MLVFALARWERRGRYMRAVLCAPLCNCRHSLRADDEERLVEVALEHMRRNHPDASVEEERIREIISSRSYDIEYIVVYEGGYGPEAEFGVKSY